MYEREIIDINGCQIIISGPVSQTQTIDKLAWDVHRIDLLTRYYADYTVSTKIDFPGNITVYITSRYWSIYCGLIDWFAKCCQDMVRKANSSDL